MVEIPVTLLTIGEGSDAAPVQEVELPLAPFGQKLLQPTPIRSTK